MSTCRVAGTGLAGGLMGWLAAGSVALAVLVALPSFAQQADRVPVDVLVTRLSNDGKGVDPEAARLHQKLRGQFNYDTLQVLEKRRLDLAVGEVGRVRLPNGRQARLSPLQLGDGDVLMAVDVEGAAKLDARVKSHNLVVIRAGQHEGGDLVLSLEPDLP